MLMLMLFGMVFASVLMIGSAVGIRETTTGDESLRGGENARYAPRGRPNRRSRAVRPFGGVRALSWLCLGDLAGIPL